MPTVKIGGTDISVQFPDSMSREEIAGVMAKNKDVRQISHAWKVGAGRKHDPFGDPGASGEKTSKSKPAAAPVRAAKPKPVKRHIAGYGEHLAAQKPAAQYGQENRPVFRHVTSQWPQREDNIASKAAAKASGAFGSAFEAADKAAYGALGVGGVKSNDPIDRYAHIGDAGAAAQKKAFGFNLLPDPIALAAKGIRGVEHALTTKPDRGRPLTDRERGEDKGRDILASVLGFANEFTSPSNLATAGAVGGAGKIGKIAKAMNAGGRTLKVANAASKVLPRAASGVFASQMLPHGEKTLREGLRDGDTDKIVRGLLSVGISKVALDHGFGKEASPYATGKEKAPRNQTLQGHLEETAKLPKPQPGASHSETVKPTVRRSPARRPRTVASHSETVKTPKRAAKIYDPPAEAQASHSETGRETAAAARGRLAAAAAARGRQKVDEDAKSGQNEKGANPAPANVDAGAGGVPARSGNSPAERGVLKTAPPKPDAGSLAPNVRGGEMAHFSEIGVHPEMQHKKTGITDLVNNVGDTLKGTSTYDVAQGGTWTVFRDKDGKLSAVNSHHRRELANRADRFVRIGPDGKAVDVEPNVPLNVLDVRDGWTVSRARAYGALENIRDNKGSAIDAVDAMEEFHYTPADLAALGVSLNGELARNMMGLTRLNPSALARVRMEDVEEAAAAGVGSVEGLSPETQDAALAEIVEQGYGTYDKARRIGLEYLADQKDGSLAQEQADAQSSMFDEYAPKVKSTRGLRVELKTKAKNILVSQYKNLLAPTSAKLRDGEHIDSAGRKTEALGMAESKAALIQRAELLYNHDWVKAEIARLAGEVGNGRLTKEAAANELAKRIAEHAGKPVKALADTSGQGLRSQGAAADGEAAKPAAKPKDLTARTRLFHGSPASDLTAISPLTSGVAGDYGSGGVHLTSDVKRAVRYSRGRGNNAAYLMGDADKTPKNGSVYEVDHTPKNPLVINNDADYAKYEKLGQEGLPESKLESVWGDRAIARYAEQSGHDAILNHLTGEHFVFTDSPLTARKINRKPAKPEDLTTEQRDAKAARAKQVAIDGKVKAAHIAIANATTPAAVETAHAAAEKEIAGDERAQQRIDAMRSFRLEDLKQQEPAAPVVRMTEARKAEIEAANAKRIAGANAANEAIGKEKAQKAQAEKDAKAAELKASGARVVNLNWDISQSVNRLTGQHGERKGEAELTRLEKLGLDTETVRDLFDDYKGADAEDKQDAYDEFVAALKGTDATEVAAVENKPKPAAAPVLTPAKNLEVDSDYILHRTDLGNDPIKVNYRGRPSPGEAHVFFKESGGGSATIPEKYLFDAEPAPVKSEGGSSISRNAATLLGVHLPEGHPLEKLFDGKSASVKLTDAQAAEMRRIVDKEKINHAEVRGLYPAEYPQSAGNTAGAYLSKDAAQTRIDARLAKRTDKDGPQAMHSGADLETLMGGAEDLRDYGIIAAHHIAEGAATFAEWTKRMAAEFPKLTKDQLTGLYAYVGGKPDAPEPPKAEPKPDAPQVAAAPTKAEEKGPTTGGKNAVTEEERKARGAEEVVRQEKQTVSASHDAGRKLVESGSVDPRRLARDVADSPRPLSAAEVGALVYDRTRLYKAYNDLSAEMDAYIDPANGAKTATPEMRRAFAALDRDLAANDDALVRGGREQSAAFAARKEMAFVDSGDFAGMSQRARRVKGGDLTPKETETIKKATGEARKKDADYENQAVKSRERQAATKKTKAEKIIAQIDRTADRKSVRSDLKTQRTDLYEKLRKTIGTPYVGSDFGGQMMSEIAPIVGELAHNLVLDGVTRLADIVDAIRTEVPEIAENHIHDALIYVKDGKPASEITKTLRKLRKEARLISDAEDETDGKDTRPQTPPMRANDTEAQAGIRAWRDAQRNIRRTTEQIEEVKTRIAAGDMIAPTKPGGPRNTLEAQLAALKTQLADNRASERKTAELARNLALEKRGIDSRKVMQAVRGKTEEQASMQAQINALRKDGEIQKKIEGLKAQLASGQFDAPTRQSAAAKTAAQSQLAELQKQKAAVLTGQRTTENLKAKLAQEQAGQDTRTGGKGAKGTEQQQGLRKGIQRERTLRDVNADIAKYQQMLEDGNFKDYEKDKADRAAAREQKKADEELDGAARERDHARAQVENAVRSLESKTRLEKAVSYARTAKIASLPVYYKLFGASSWSLPVGAMEDLFGAGFGKLSAGGGKRLSDIAAREGQFSLKAEGVKARAMLFSKDARKNAMQMMKTGTNEIKSEIGAVTPDPGPLNAGNFTGRTHGAEKSFLQTGEYKKALFLRERRAAAQGLDVSDENVRAKMRTGAAVEAQNAILQGENLAAAEISAHFSKMRNSKHGSVHVAGAMLETLIPIVKTASNYVGKSIDATGVGVVRGAAMHRKALGAAKRSGVPMSAETADAILRAYKSGGVAAIAILAGTGAIPGVKFGGYYHTPKKGDAKNAVSDGEVEIGGVRLPHVVSHSPFLEACQFWATARQNYSAESRAHHSDVASVAGATGKAALGLLSQAPGVESVAEAGQILTGKGNAGKSAGHLVAGDLVPGVVRNFAQWTDRDRHGKLVKRKERGFRDAIKAGIPVLRKQIPAKPKGK